MGTKQSMPLCRSAPSREFRPSFIELDVEIVQTKISYNQELLLILEEGGKLIILNVKEGKEVIFGFNIHHDKLAGGLENVVDGDWHINSKTLLTRNDILMNKTGLDIEEYEYIKTDPNNKSPARKNLIDRLNFLLQLKKKLVNKCKFNNNKTHYLHYNTDAYDEISNLIQNLDSQGY